ncbi:hypothetical protein MKX01_036344 [Papaver californicum]|nr:hypothetical protein MKX01_036344 [Papaver californicum]
MKPKRRNFSKYLIALLSYGGMDDFLLAKMILCGIPLAEPFLKERLSVLMREDLKSLKEGKVPMNDSYYLMGTADPTGILKPDQVCVILENGQISGDVLVYKHPGLHFGDIHILTATYVKELENFLLNSFTPSTPWTQTYFAKNVSHLKPTDFRNAYELEHHLFGRFLAARFSNAEKIKEVEGKLIHLRDIYYDALGVAKSGKKRLVEIPPKLRQHKTPHFMQNKSSGPYGLNNSPLSLRKDNSYHSKSVLGQIFDGVESYEEFGDQQVIDLVSSRKCYFAWKVACQALCEYYLGRQNESTFMCTESAMREILNS